MCPAEASASMEFEPEYCTNPFEWIHSTHGDEERPSRRGDGCRVCVAWRYEGDIGEGERVSGEAMERALAGGPAVRVEHDGAPAWGRRDGDAIVLADGTRDPGGARRRYLAPGRADEDHRRPPDLPQPDRRVRGAAPAVPVLLHEAADDAERPPRRRSAAQPAPRSSTTRASSRSSIGRRMQGVGIDDALDHVAGYTCANDVGLHDFRHADRGAMLRVKGQDGFLPLGPRARPRRGVRPHRLHAADVRQRRGRPGGDRGRPALARRLPAGRPVPADHARAGRRRPHRDAGELAPDGARRHRRGRDRRDRAAREHVEEWDVDLTGAGEQPATSANTLHVALAVPEDEAERMAERSRT